MKNGNNFSCDVNSRKKCCGETSKRCYVQMVSLNMRKYVRINRECDQQIIYFTYRFLQNAWNIDGEEFKMTSSGLLLSCLKAVTHTHTLTQKYQFIFDKNYCVFFCWLDKEEKRKEKRKKYMKKIDEDSFNSFLIIIFYFMHKNKIVILHETDWQLKDSHHSIELTHTLHAHTCITCYFDWILSRS